MDAEEYIRRSLDGTFTVVMPDGKTKTIDVRNDFVPKHSINESYASARNNITTFSPAEDERIISLRKQKVTWAKIAADLWMSQAMVERRYKTLCVTGKVRSAHLDKRILEPSV